MNVHDFFIPPTVIYGQGSLDRLAEEAVGLGRKALLVVGSGSLARSGALDRIQDLLRSKAVTAVLFEGVEPDPAIETVDRGAEQALESGCQMVIAAGGGSVIDTGKAIAGMVTNDGSVREYLEGREITEKPLPCIAIPTTAGTGAEVTKNSVLTNRQGLYKKSIRHRWLIPTAAIVDPALTLSLPSEVTASTGMDTLAQLIEPYVSRKSTPMTDALALYGMELVGRSLQRAVANGSDVEARSDMSLASLLSGMALANSGLGAAHALSHPMGAHRGVPHGVGCAILLPYVMEFNLPAAREKYARVATALGEDTHGLSADEAARQAIGRVHALCKEIGIPPRLSAVGIHEEDLRMIARESHGSSLTGNPVETSDEELVALLRKAL
jgi:alcohol dehydrogenase class IV